MLSPRHLGSLCQTILEPLDQWSKRCHEASLFLVKSGQLPEGARVARGACKGVASQHSWVVLGSPYDPTMIIDPTVWSYTGEVPHVRVIAGDSNHYFPKGAGLIWKFGRPPEARGEVLTLNIEPSKDAALFLEMCGPLDRAGWMALANSPVGGWPAGEIIGAMYDDERFAAMVPIDVVGMVTDLNPHGLYF